ncbi:MAG: DNA topoisomerase I [Pyrodictiaceae archaeon]
MVLYPYKTRPVKEGRRCPPNNYVLVIAEKPKAAKRIAEALAKSSGLLYKCSYYGVSYWVTRFKGNLMVVAPLVGHLFGLYTPSDGFPVFDYEWYPLFEIDESANYTKRYFQLMSFLARRAESFINACDYDIEGSLIGFLAIKLIAKTSNYYRAVFSALTDTDIVRAFKQLSPPDKLLVEAGHARHELDWIWGINVSRALMYALKKIANKRISLSAGRVQSPTLIAVVKREEERNLFIPLPYFEVYTEIVLPDSRRLKLLFGAYNKLIDAKELARALKASTIVLVDEVKREYVVKPPPPPFNLGDLQAEAARIYGYSPSKTQAIAEKLYIEALISYPRTNSQRIPESIDIKSILSGLAKLPEYAKLANMLLEKPIVPRPRNGPKTDPAHPAIHPTGDIRAIRDLTPHEKRIYDLIVRRFLASMYPPLRIVKETIVFKAPKIARSSTYTAISVIDEGWLKAYPFIKITGAKPINLRKGEKLRIARVWIAKRYTSPPPRYTKASLVKWMEANRIGTEATRARIVDTLFERGYLKLARNGIVVTPLGYSVASILGKYFPKLTSVSLTREFERMLEDIRLGKRSREEIINEAKELIRNLMMEFKSKHLEAAGLELAKSLGIIKPTHRCILCDLEAIAKEPFPLCKHHYNALKTITETYKAWSDRLEGEGIDFKEYLASIIRLKSTGSWVKEVASLLLSKYGEKPS